MEKEDLKGEEKTSEKYGVLHISEVDRESNLNHSYLGHFDIIHVDSIALNFNQNSGPLS